MKLTIHRGTHEIGGSCIELEAKNTRIVLDIGMPLVDERGEQFNFRPYKRLSGPELIKRRFSRMCLGSTGLTKQINRLMRF